MFYLAKKLYRPEFFQGNRRLGEPSLLLTVFVSVLATGIAVTLAVTSALTLRDTADRGAPGGIECIGRRGMGGYRSCGF